MALLFSGLVRNGPAGTIVPDLAERWSVDATGKTWTVDLRSDATWHDGVPVTADDVIFTIRTLQDPAYSGPSSTSWSEVAVTSSGPRRVVFSLRTPLGGFLQALTQPLAPAHLMGDIPIEELGDNEFGRQPVGSGPFALVELTDTSASLVPAGDIVPVEEEGSPDPSAAATANSLASPRSSTRPTRPRPYLAGIDMRYYPIRTSWRPTSARAPLTRSRASRASSRRSSAASRHRLLRYPGATLTTVLLNLRPSHPEFANPAVRTALLKAIDRGAIIDEAYATSAASATGPIPPSSPLFDPAADPLVTYDRKGASKALTAAGWTHKKDGWYLPKAAKPLDARGPEPDAGHEPGPVRGSRGGRPRLDRPGLRGHPRGPAARRVRDRPAGHRDFQVAVADVMVGLDPDLYPLLASSQTLTGGSNVMGVQDPALDALLAAARAPGTDDARTRRTARSRSSSRRVATCSRWPSRTRSWWPATRWKDRSCARFRTPRIDSGMC